MGGLPGLFGTGYGQIALVKLALFIVLLTLAALNRLALTERLAESKTGAARRLMRASIAFEAVLGTIVIILAGFLASRTPATHEQPVWPFAWRPSLAVMADPDLRREVIGALVATGGGCACVLLHMAPGALAGSNRRNRCVPARDTTSRSAVRAGLSDQLLHFTHRVRGDGHRTRRQAVLGKLRHLSWCRRAW